MGGVDEGGQHGLHLLGEVDLLRRAFASVDWLRAHVDWLRMHVDWLRALDGSRPVLVLRIGLHQVHQPVLLRLGVSGAGVDQGEFAHPTKPAIGMPEQGDDDLFALVPLVQAVRPGVPDGIAPAPYWPLGMVPWKVRYSSG